MTYDNWKTTNPADAELGDGREWANCEKCGKYRPLLLGNILDSVYFICDECEEDEDRRQP